MTLLLLALACAPATLTIGGGNTISAQPGTPETTDDIPVAAITENEPAWSHTWLEFNVTLGSPENDNEPELKVLFSDGTWKQTENGWLEIGPADPTTITMVVSMVTLEVINPHDVVAALTVEMESQDYTSLGEMVPTSVGESGGSVTYEPPPDD